MNRIIQIVTLVLFAAGCGGAARHTAPDVSGAAEQPRPEAEEQGNSPRGMHPSWDIDNDGINDCEKDGSCDHTVDYSKPRKLR